MEHLCSLLQLQAPAICPYPELDQSNLGLSTPTV